MIEAAHATYLLKSTVENQELIKNPLSKAFTCVLGKTEGEQRKGFRQI